LTRIHEDVAAAGIEALRADYDATPYKSYAIAQSAPGQLAAIAHLFGLESADVATARVLEIGCAGGGNIIPFAAAHPEARVVGIDLSPVQIEQARAGMAALGLDNVELLVGDLAEADLTGLGQFDFIICHGVYSWAPDHVQDAILSAFRRLLAPEGVAYISYNTYPGWKSKEVMRDAMLLAGGASGTPEQRATDARRMAGFLEEVAPADSVLARVVAEFRDRDAAFGDFFLLHDQLEAFQSPCYFYEMVGRAAEKGLVFLGEARPETMVPANHGPKVAEFLAEKCSGVQVLVEQYIDFAINRSFRESLFVHVERAKQINYQPDPHRYQRLHFAAWTPPADGETKMDRSRQEYVEVDGGTLFTNDPGVKAALESLNDRWPWTMSRQELIDTVKARLIAAGFNPSATIADTLDNLLAVLIGQGQARFRLDPVLPDPTPTPLRVDDAARRMAALTARDDASTFNAWHEPLVLSPVDRYLVPLLDGTRDRDALVDALVTIDAENPIDIEDGDDRSRRDLLAEQVDTLPQRLAEMKLIRID
jgi:SAM-dependent methyltransferase